MIELSWTYTIKCPQSLIVAEVLVKFYVFGWEMKSLSDLLEIARNKKLDRRDEMVEESKGMCTG